MVRLQPFCNQNPRCSTGLVGTAWDSSLTISLEIDDFFGLCVTRCD
jgi:hypothetical protein